MAKNNGTAAVKIAVDNGVKVAQEGIQGTSVALMAQGVTLNGKRMGATDFGFLRKYCFGSAVKIVGYAERAPEARGKGADILSLVSGNGMTFGLANGEPTAAVSAEPSHTEGE